MQINLDINTLVVLITVNTGQPSPLQKVGGLANGADFKISNSTTSLDITNVINIERSAALSMMIVFLKKKKNIV